MTAAIHSLENLDSYSYSTTSEESIGSTPQSDITDSNFPAKSIAMVQSKSLLAELPFFPVGSQKLDNEVVEGQSEQYTDPLELTPFELLLDGHRIEKTSSDGFVGFHHVTIVTSSAKYLSKYFQLIMGFEEVAYRSLETGSRLIASHVIQNGKVVIEFVNTLVDLPINPPLSHLPKPFNELVDEKLRYNDLKNENFHNHFEGMVDKLISRNLINDKENMDKLKFDIKHYLSSETDEFYSKTVTAIEDQIDLFEFRNYLAKHGEGIIDVSFEVINVDDTFEKAVKSGANVLKYPKIIRDNHGSVKTATVVLPNTDIRHTLIENIDYKGKYLPNYGLVSEDFRPFNATKLEMIDHVVENYTWNEMMQQAEFYAKVFGFRKFWSVDEKDISTDNSSLRSIVLSSVNGNIKFPINEPSKGKFKSQIEEFYDYNGGPGIQHIALRTNNIIESVSSMETNGVNFNKAPPGYYTGLERRMKQSNVSIYEDFEIIKKLNILVDFDPDSGDSKSKKCNYILQIFTNPINDRPTLFIEIIQRHHHNGFGKGTFKGLYETIEEQQRLRGNLVESKGKLM